MYFCNLVPRSPNQWLQRCFFLILLYILSFLLDCRFDVRGSAVSFLYQQINSFHERVKNGKRFYPKQKFFIFISQKWVIKLIETMMKERKHNIHEIIQEVLKRYCDPSITESATLLESIKIDKNAIEICLIGLENIRKLTTMVVSNYLYNIPSLSGNKIRSFEGMHPFLSHSILPRKKPDYIQPLPSALSSIHTGAAIPIPIPEPVRMFGGAQTSATISSTTSSMGGDAVIQSSDLDRGYNEIHLSECSACSEDDIICFICDKYLVDDDMLNISNKAEY